MTLLLPLIIVAAMAVTPVSARTDVPTSAAHTPLVQHGGAERVARGAP